METRLKVLFESLEKTTKSKSAFKSKDDELNQTRAAAQKLLQHIEGQEKLNRDAVLRHTSYVTCLVQTLITVYDRSVQTCVVTCIAELLGRSNVSKRAGIFVRNGASQALCQVLSQEWREASPSEPFLILIHQVLAKLSVRDKKLATKARLCQCLPVTLGLIRQHLTPGNKNLMVLLALLKVYASSQQNSSYLGRNGAVSHMLKLIELCGKRQLTLLRNTLETLCQLTKLKSNAARAIGMDCVPQLLNMFVDWQKQDAKNRNVAIRKNLLFVLRQLVVLKSGRMALQAQNGLQILYSVCVSSGELEAEPVVSAASLILRQCAPKNKLPVSHFYSPLTFRKEDTTNDSTIAGIRLMLPDACDDDGDSVDEDDDVISDEEELDVCEQEQEVLLSSGVDSRSLDELEQTYIKFVPEMVPACMTDTTATPQTVVIDSSLKSFKVDSPVSSYIPKKRSSSSSLSSQEVDLGFVTSRYVKLSAQTKSVMKFELLGYPDLVGATPPPYREACVEKKATCSQAMIMEDIRRWVNPSDIIEKVVFDLDSLLHSSQNLRRTNNLVNEDELRVDSLDASKPLQFESRFESGNLRKVIQIRQHEYDLILSPDVNHHSCIQWFYFRVSNVESGVAYRFNIINCEKVNSQFNFGMRPLVCSVKESLLGRAYWLRTGKKMCYYRNQYVRAKSAGVPARGYYTTSFTVTFKHAGDVVYMAYHYPYTLTRLRADLQEWGCVDPTIFYQEQILATTLGGNLMSLLTITANPPDPARPVIFLSSRIHPGESNASWVMRGLLNHLLGSSVTAKTLREQFVFKIVPMLNPDGVVNGNHRCSLLAEDLNRTWHNPTSQKQPTIYHTKGLMSFLCRCGRAPFVYIDFHGHSRKKNIFMYGCSPTQSWMSFDTDNPGWLENGVEDPAYKSLPRLLAQLAPAFSWSNCNFSIERAKETTGRVVVWRHLRVLRSYTMEATYSSCDQGPYRGFQVSPRELEEMGAKICEGFLRLRSFKQSASPELQEVNGERRTSDPEPAESELNQAAGGEASNSEAGSSVELSDSEDYL